MKRLRVSEIYRDDRFLLLAVESVGSSSTRLQDFHQFVARIEPHAVIVRSPAGMYALDMEGRPASLDDLVQGMPALEGMLAT